MQASKEHILIFFRRHLLFLFIPVLMGCEYFQPNEALTGRKVVARIEDETLYQDDLERTIPRNISSDDSIKLADKIVQDWIKKKLLVNRALEELALDQEQIEARIQEYRDALIVHEFEKLYINSHLDTEVDSSEIGDYYLNNSDNFVLKQNIVRCLFARIPKTAPDLQRIRRNIRSYPNANKEDIEEYCLRYAMNSFLDDSVWVNFEELIMGTPIQEIDDKIRWLNNTQFSETRDDSFVFFVRILEFKISNELSPLAFIKDDIESIIINKRKLELKRDLETTVYEEGIKNKSFEVLK